jgi:hypothetical protein
MRRIVFSIALLTLAWCGRAEAEASSGGGLTLISTQTASNSASLQFTSLPTSYNTLFLNCSNVIASAKTLPRFFVLEGDTWEPDRGYAAAVQSSWQREPSSVRHYSLKGYIDNDSSITGIKLVPSDGTWIAGKCSLYGMN